jgi:hypothetical protein
MKEKEQYRAGDRGARNSVHAFDGGREVGNKVLEQWKERKAC